MSEIKMTINGSVGRGGKNNRQDVETVQMLLNTHLPFDRMMAADGKCGPLTRKAIYAFQMHKFGKADGRVDPGYRTMKTLAGPTPDQITMQALAAAEQAEQAHKSEGDTDAGVFRGPPASSDKRAVFAKLKDGTPVIYEYNKEEERLSELTFENAAGRAYYKEGDSILVYKKSPGNAAAQFPELKTKTPKTWTEILVCLLAEDKTIGYLITKVEPEAQGKGTLRTQAVILTGQRPTLLSKTWNFSQDGLHKKFEECDGKAGRKLMVDSGEAICWLVETWASGGLATLRKRAISHVGKKILTKGMRELLERTVISSLLDATKAGVTSFATEYVRQSIADRTGKTPDKNPQQWVKPAAIQASSTFATTLVTGLFTPKLIELIDAPKLVMNTTKQYFKERFYTLITIEKSVLLIKSITDAWARSSTSKKPGAFQQELEKSLLGNLWGLIKGEGASFLGDIAVL